MIQSTKELVGVVALGVIIAFCAGWLFGNETSRCAETRGGKTCVEYKQGGETELIFYPDKVVRD